MSTVFIAHCHDRKKQGAEIPREPGMSEWFLAQEVNHGIVLMFLESRHMAMRLGSTLRLRIESIKAHCRRMERECSGELHTVAVEVHFNEMPSRPQQRGYFCMVEDGDKESEKLAECILKEMKLPLSHSKSRGINRVDEDYRWIGKRWKYRPKDPDESRIAFCLDIPCPSVVIECGYLSNPVEAQWFMSLANRHVLGRAIGKGILTFLEVENDSHSSRTGD